MFALRGFTRGCEVGRVGFDFGCVEVGQRVGEPGEGEEPGVAAEPPQRPSGADARLCGVVAASGDDGYEQRCVAQASV